VQKALEKMQPLVKVYWLRVALGIIAAFVCVVFGIAAQKIPHNPPGGAFPVDYLFFINSITLALIVYLISYYIIKSRFMLKVEKPSKLATTGIGIYFMAWLIFWILLYTIIVVA
jgi:multisubunit Na+/H+ antiporter MnhB subunit